MLTSAQCNMVGWQEALLQDIQQGCTGKGVMLLLLAADVIGVCCMLLTAALPCPVSSLKCQAWLHP